MTLVAFFYSARSLSIWVACIHKFAEQNGEWGLARRSWWCEGNYITTLPASHPESFPSHIAFRAICIQPPSRPYTNAICPSPPRTNFTSMNNNHHRHQCCEPFPLPQKRPQQSLNSTILPRMQWSCDPLYSHIECSLNTVVFCTKNYWSFYCRVFIFWGRGGGGGGGRVGVATLFVVPKQIHLRLERAWDWHSRRTKLFALLLRMRVGWGHHYNVRHHAVTRVASICSRSFILTHNITSKYKIKIKQW
jgi:hypothetical protein